MLPVFTEGALFSAGDAHYAQGDSECCGTAIEMDCTLHVSFRVRKGEADDRGINFPYFERDDYFTSPEMAAPRRFLASTGMCIANGVNESENGTLASRQALLNMIHLLMERGWSREQAYCICSVAVGPEGQRGGGRTQLRGVRRSCRWIYSCRAGVSPMAVYAVRIRRKLPDPLC